MSEIEFKCVLDILIAAVHPPAKGPGHGTAQDRAFSRSENRGNAPNSEQIGNVLLKCSELLYSSNKIGAHKYVSFCGHTIVIASCRSS